MTSIQYIGLGHTVPMLTKASVNTGSDGVTECLEPAAAWEITIDSPEARPCKVHYLNVCVVLSLLANKEKEEGTWFYLMRRQDPL